jgi:hypothetical protein
MTIDEIRRLGISSRATFDKLVRYGWIDSSGRSLSPDKWVGKTFVPTLANVASDLDKGEGMKLNETRRRRSFSIFGTGCRGG